MKKNEEKYIAESLEYIIANMATKDDLELKADKADLEMVKTELNEVKVDLNEVKVDLNEVKGTVNKIYNILDESTSKIQEDEMERAALSYKVDRHDGWIKAIATKTDVKLAEA